MKSSFIALSGPTNSGKSTLLNCFANKKVSIVSKKYKQLILILNFQLIIKILR